MTKRQVEEDDEAGEESEESRKTKKCDLCCFPNKRKAKAKEEARLAAEAATKDGAAPSSRETSPETMREPYSVNLKPKKLDDTCAIRISGRILPSCVRFAVDLIVGVDDGSSNGGYLPGDIGFHLNPRLDRNYVVRNSRLKGLWGDEETVSTVKSTFRRDEDFELDLFLAQNEFFVSINGEHFCSYKMRVPVHLLSMLKVRGDVEVHDVVFEKWIEYPKLAPGGSDPSCWISPRSAEQARRDAGDVRDVEGPLAVPCTFRLTEGFQPGWQLDIRGRVKLLPHSFYVNLQQGTQMWPHPIIPLHLNPRFDAACKDNVFVRNSWSDGKWGREERSPLFQFSPGTPFDLSIRRAADHFSVWVDGRLTGEFMFRSSVDAIDAINALYIQGDVFVDRVVLYDDRVDFERRDSTWSVS